MEKIILAKTNETPKISFDPERGFLDIIGASYPKNPIEFYKPLLDVIEEFTSLSDKKAIHAEFFIEYLNSSSS